MRRFWINLSFYTVFYSILIVASVYGWILQAVERLVGEESQ